MKACKRWITTADAKCSLCRVECKAGAKGVLADLATPVEATTIVKFVCLECADAIAATIYTASGRS